MSFGRRGFYELSMKYYVIAKFPDKENEIYLSEDRQSAEVLVGNICKSIADILSPQHLTIVQKDNTTTIRWDGKVMVSISISPENEIEVTDLSTESE